MESKQSQSFLSPKNKLQIYRKKQFLQFRYLCSNLTLMKQNLLIICKLSIFEIIIGGRMLNQNTYESLTHHGVHQLFVDKFQARQFTLQIITYIPSQETSFQIFLSDGFAWIRGQLIGQAKQYALKCNQMKTFTVIRFTSEDIFLDHEKLTFRLKKILQVKTTIHNIIGEPIPYDEFKKKGFQNVIGSNKIENIATVYKLKDVKQMPTGKISGAIIAKVIRKPDKVNNFLNIIIEDDEREQIQCCCFGAVAQKYHPILKIGAWFRFQDPVLQLNNKQGGVIQLKINNYSNIQKVKMDAPKEQVPSIGLLKIRPSGELKPKQTSFPQSQFRIGSIQNGSAVQDLDYFVIARVLKINFLKDNIGRSLTCVDRQGNYLQITLWSQFQEQEILINETYRFSRMKAKTYKGQLSLQSRKAFTKIVISDNKIVKKSEPKTSVGVVASEKSKPNKHEKTLGINEIVYTMGELLEKSSTSKEKTCYGLTLATLIVKFQYWGNNYQFSSELRKKLFFMNCEKCEGNDYVRGKVEPELVEGRPSCSNCKSTGIKIMWNIKASLCDSEFEIACKINSEIVEKLLGMTPVQGLIQFLRSPQQLKKKILKKINLLKGVYKISAKINQKKEGERFYNICQYFADGLKVYLRRSLSEMKMADEAYKEFCLPKENKSDDQYPIPSFLKKSTEAVEGQIAQQLGLFPKNN